VTDAVHLPPGGTPPAGGSRGRGEAQPGDNRRLAILVLVFGIVLLAAAAAAVVAIGLGKRDALRAESERRNTAADKGPVVQVARVALSPSTREVRFTADVRGFFQTTMYAKISGYVRDVRVDKGERVTRGQILGSVESPETDEAVASAEFTESLRRKVQRRTHLLAPDILAEQDLDTATSDLGVSNSNVKSALAMKRYEVIRAPFDGVVTARYVDPGALMPAATGGTESALPFVDVEMIDTLRIDAYVTQEVAQFVRVGDAATVWQNERPTVRVSASVARTSGGLDPRTRTMLVEVDVDNRGVGILPGTFANVDLRVTAMPIATVPVEALVVRAGKNMVARVEHNRVHLAEVDVGQTNGRTLQVLRGLALGDHVALDLPLDVADGAPIQAEEKEPQGPGSDAKP